LTGSPADLYLPIDATVEQRQEFMQRHGFDRPLIVQFGDFLVGLSEGDLGHSIRKDRPALDVVLEAVPVTLWLAAVTMVLAIGSAILVGSLAARHPGGAFDRIASIASLAGASAPDFWVAISAILLFAVTLGWLPTSGMGGPLTWILPIAVLVIRPFGILVQVVRNTMVGVMSAPYVKTARAKGIGERPIIFVHALRNAMLPVITVAGDQAAGIINGAVIVETIFGWPGVGKLMIDAIVQRDFAIIQASIFVTATLIFVLNIAIDLAYTVLDPRVREA
jgi:peptide/nickel transport system permease protein